MNQFVSFDMFAKNCSKHKKNESTLFQTAVCQNHEVIYIGGWLKYALLFRGCENSQLQFKAIAWFIIAEP